MTTHSPPIKSTRRQQILTLALPIIGGMVSQNVLNLVDGAMVAGMGDAALAAVGLGGILNYVLSALVLGLGSGVQAIAARRLGEGKHTEVALSLNGGLFLALVFAVPWSALIIYLAPDLFSTLIDDPAVLAEGVPYLQTRLVAMTALGMNFAFRGYWNAINQSAVYMRTLIFMHAVNIFMNWVLIFGNLGAPELGVTGAFVHMWRGEKWQHANV